MGLRNTSVEFGALAKALHWLVAMTVATGGKGLPFFGRFSIPLPVAENHDNHEFWEEIHELTWKPIAVLLTLHVLAALNNHFVARNDVLRRMTVGVN